MKHYRQVTLDGKTVWMKGDTLAAPPIDRKQGRIICSTTSQNSPSSLWSVIEHEKTDERGSLILREIWKSTLAELTVAGLKTFIATTEAAFKKHDAKFK